jgi:PTS system mannose-specific IIC component
LEGKRLEISFFQALLIGIVYYLGTVGTPWLTLLGSISFMYKPLVAGTVVGFIMGDPVQGCIIGAAINLPYIAFISAGGTVPVDPGLAGSLGTALALAAKVNPSVAITLAVPLGLLGTLIWVVHMTVDVFFVHLADKAAEESQIGKICFLHIVPPQIFMFLICVIPVTVGAYFGVSYVSPMIKSLTGVPLHVLQVIGQILPAIGIAMNLRAISRPGTLLFFVFGFILKSYSSLNIITIAMLAAILAYFYTKLTEDRPTLARG